MNYKLLIQYDGTDFHGWQVQENARTIQGELERVIGMLEDRKVGVIGSGRTDAGVPAEGQVANVMIDRSFTPDKLRSAINGNLWRDIRILKAEKDALHALTPGERLILTELLHKVASARAESLNAASGGTAG